MSWLRFTKGTGAAPILLCVVLGMLTGCGSSTPGRMEWVQPTTEAPRVGTVYCIRGWCGIYSVGIDQIAAKLNAQGIRARVFMPEQYPELAATMVERYKNAPRHEPICFVGHSRGVDSSLIIARELDKVGVPVDLIACFDSVDETTVSKNVRWCYNFWMPGIYGNTNLFRGIPLTQAPGSTGQLFNCNCAKECRSWRGNWTNHINFDEDPALQQRIINHILEVCPERSQWVPPGSISSNAAR